MKKLYCITLSVILLLGCTPRKSQSLAGIPYGQKVAIPVDVLKDKIKGGWAGQTIGCTYGGPTEFKYRGALIHDETPIIWYDDYARETFELDPGLYDDVYMDLTFVEVIERCGLDAPADSFAIAFANADYKLWHANQAARYNILNGIMPPASGHWINNPHADDIDFQIEADFAGMLCPGMVNTASGICDKIGHIMNYGDGWYGGVYMSAMYALAFVNDDIAYIVREGLKTIPPQSKFRRCIEEVISLYEKDPTDWKKCWFEIEKKHASEIGCPEGVFNAFNIDATINSAYVVIGLLYGNGDFFRTMDIATRCGQDSDCNPASAVGILGVIKGYSGIPDYWKPALEKVEALDFPYTSISLEKIYEINFNQIVKVASENGGELKDGQLYVELQQPAEVPWEQSFTGHYPHERRVVNKEFQHDTLSVSFDGNGLVVMGMVKQLMPGNPAYVARLEAWLDGEKVETFDMPYDYIKRKYDIFYKYQLPQGKHHLMIRWLNPVKDFAIQTKDIVIYADQPVQIIRPE